MIMKARLPDRACDQDKAIKVGKEGVEPSRPFGHTDLNRARLPFRHFPGTAGLRDPSLAERLERHYAALGATEE